jgi:hypothetical protein
VSAWSQYRSYASWPTEALLVGPNASRAKWMAWAISFVVGLGLGLVWWRTASKSFFTLGAREGIVSVLPVLVGVLLVPMVIVAFILPRIGGPILILAALVSVLCILPASHFDVAMVIVATLGLYAPMCCIGLGFAWSGLRSERQ